MKAKKPSYISRFFRVFRVIPWPMRFRIWLHPSLSVFVCVSKEVLATTLCWPPIAAFTCGFTCAPSFCSRPLISFSTSKRVRTSATSRLYGYVGLALFLLLWALVWRNASWINRQSRSRKNLHWASDLARMIQVSLIGYAVGGAFLNLAYYDVPYNLLIALVLTRILVEKEIKSVDQQEGVFVRPQMNAGKAGSQQAVSRTRFEPQRVTNIHV